MSVWKPISSAPHDGSHILLLTSDFGVVEGWWDGNVESFYASQVGWASYEPDPAKRRGDWVSDWAIRGPINDAGNAPDRRLYCGSTPQYWRLTPALPRQFVRELAKFDALVRV